MERMEMRSKMKEQLQTLKVAYDEVLGRFLGKEDFYLRMLKKFLGDQNFQGLEEAAAQKNWQEAFKYAHTVKGLCGNLGLGGILEYIVPLTEALRNEPYDEAVITENLDGAVQEYRKAVEVISSL